MILSMTGYGAASAQKDDIAVSVEIRTVNHRFLDLHVRVPREYLVLEGEIQRAVRKVLDRGRVEISLSIQNTGPTEFLVNEGLVRGFLEAGQKLKENYKIQGDLDIKAILSLPGILQNRDLLSEAPGIVSELTFACIEKALESVLHMRRHEGDSLRTVMLGHLGVIEQDAARIRELSAASAAETLQKLQARLEQLLPPAGGGVDPQRLAQEAALLADKADISEEIARLKSHIAQYRSLVDAEEKTGKKLDFLLQELHRETNTILSKSGSLEIANHAIAIKTEIEKLREQVQNVE
ncbi:MAG: YicC family protein [Acidobacteria bacterium]|nr:YicC family protein [Acidobacteriota bacterium]